MTQSKKISQKISLFWTVSVVWLLFLSTIAFLGNLGATNLVDETEPLFAEASRQMTITGDWITPYFNEQTRFDKPPLIYWTQAIAYLLIGVNEWAVRLPSALSAIGLMILLFYTLWKCSTSQTNADSNLHLLPFLGSGMMALNIETIAWARIGVSDMLLTGCMGSALLAFFLGYIQQDPLIQQNIYSSDSPRTTKNLFRWLPPFKGGREGDKGGGGGMNHSSNQNSDKAPTNLWYLAFYIFIALAILTKGPVGIVLPGLIILLFLLYLGNFWPVIQEMKPIRGLMIILAIALPWYILVTWANGEAYLNTFFGYHNFERFTNVVNKHSAPWYFYLIVVLMGFAPWSLYLPVAIARIKWWQRNYWQRQPRIQQLALFALAWFVGIFGFFTVAATKLPSYVLPLMPAAAILVALLFTTNYPQSGKNYPGLSKSILITAWVNVGFFLLLAVACLLLPSFLEEDPAMPNFQSALEASGVNIHGAIILAVSAIAVAMILLFPNLITGLRLPGNAKQTDTPKISVTAPNRGHTIWTINLIGFFAFFIFAVMPTMRIFDAQRQQPVREMATILMQEKQPQEEIVMIAFEKPSLVFYSHQPVTFFRRSTDAYNYLKEKAETEKAQASDPKSLLILGWPNKLRGAGLRSHHYQAFYEIEPYQLVRVNLDIFRTIEIKD